MSVVFSPFTGTLDYTGFVSVGSFQTTSTAQGLTSAGSVISLTAADQTNPGALTATAQSINGNKTFLSTLYANGGIDLSSSGTLAIGTSTNTTTINIGNVGCTVNIQGTVITETTTTLNVTNPVFTVNAGGAAGSASNAGMQVQENNVITGYVETSGDRNSWVLLAPNTAGIATITPGSAGITLNQSSHNPVTIGTANGLSLSTQVLSLASASSSTTGALLSSDWNTFNNKQPAGNYITALTGDVTASGPGSAAATVAFVGGSSAANVHSAELLANAATSLNTASALVARDSSGNFSAGTITATLSGNASTATLAGNVTGIVAPANGGLGVNTSPAAGAIPIGTGSGYNISTISAGTGISVTNGTGSITVACTNTVSSPGDIAETSFTPSNNQSSAANVTGLAFSNSVVRSAIIQYSVVIHATTSLYEQGQIYLIQNGSGWYISQTSQGDVSGLVFTVTSAGQIQYTSSNVSGFTSAKLQYRAQTTSV